MFDNILERYLHPFGQGVYAFYADGGEGADETEGDDPDTEETETEEAPEAPEGYVSQDKLDAIISERLDREREKWKAKLEEEREEQKRKAEEERLAEQEKWHDLAEQRQERITQLEVQAGEVPVLQERIDQLEETLNGYLEAQRDGLPDAIIALLDKMDVVEQLAWISENAGELVGDDRQRLPGAPKPRGKGEPSDDEKRKRAVDVRRLW